VRRIEFSNREADFVKI